mgnify:FL=1|jgi:protein-disulfide isomerase|tara:strand:+ start:1369 stop:2010 length:642 start_codon:yes stop_codon:yes gene_type:complete
MNKRATITAALFIALGVATTGLLYNQLSTGQRDESVAQDAGELMRPHSPVIGPADAPVTIVKFFDPACEGCRAFYPIVKELMAEYPDGVRLVLRYVLFHRSSEEAARILEAARKQGVYLPVLEAVFAVQPRWHGDPQAAAAWEAAKAAGLDVKRAREQITGRDITAILEQDAADAKAIGIPHTPTFYVNGKALPSFGPENLRALVRSEVERVQ